LGEISVQKVFILREGFIMKNNKRNALLFLLPAICFLFVGIANYNGRPFLFYGDIVAGILFILVAIKNYKRKNTLS
jgi:hypothetical protein